jgi:uncharacterized protein
VSHREEILSTLHTALPILSERYGVTALWLFGSVARAEDTKESDINLLAEFDRPVSIFELAHLQRHLAVLLGRRVELGTPDSLHGQVLCNVLAERIHVA